MGNIERGIAGAALVLSQLVAAGCSGSQQHVQTPPSEAECQRLAHEQAISPSGPSFCEIAGYHRRPPPLTAGHGDVTEPHRVVTLDEVGTLQVDPGPYQIWEDWGAGWKLVGFVNVTAPTTNTRIERWAFLRYDATTNPNGYHTPNQSNTQVYLWLGRVGTLTDGQGAIPFATTEGPNPSQNDQEFQNSAQRALKVLAGWYGGVTTQYTFINASAGCPANLPNCSLVVLSPENQTTATPAATTATPAATTATPRAH